MLCTARFSHRCFSFILIYLSSVGLLIFWLFISDFCPPKHIRCHPRRHNLELTRWVKPQLSSPYQIVIIGPPNQINAIGHPVLGISLTSVEVGAKCHSPPPSSRQGWVIFFVCDKWHFCNWYGRLKTIRTHATGLIQSLYQRGTLHDHKTWKAARDACRLNSSNWWTIYPSA